MAELVIQQFGLMYPPRIHIGSLLLISSPESLGNEIEMFCSTVKGERILIPDWGLPDLIHRPERMKAEVLAVIRFNLERYFRGVTFEIRIVNEKEIGTLEIEIKYTAPIGYGIVIITI